MATVRRVVDHRIDPFDLRLFAAVVEHGSITAAAASVSLSLGAASSRLKALEHRVGAQLLRRSKAGARTTDAGLALARHAARVLAEIDALHLAMSAFGQGLRGTVRLCCNTAGRLALGAGRLAPFLQAHPALDLELQELPSEAILDALRRGAADVGIVADHVDCAGLHARPWMDDELVAALPRPARGLRDAQGAPVRFNALLGRPFVGLPADSGLSRFLQQQALRCGRLQQHRVRVADVDTVLQLVAAGVGVAVLPRHATAAPAAAGVQFAPLAEGWARRRLLLCTPAAEPDRPAVRALLQALA